MSQQQQMRDEQTWKLHSIYETIEYMNKLAIVERTAHLTDNQLAMLRWALGISPKEKHETTR